MHAHMRGHMHTFRQLCPPQNQLILGVMGVDIALNEIKSLTPRYKVGTVDVLTLPCTGAGVAALKHRVKMLSADMSLIGMNSFHSANCVPYTAF